MRNLGFNRQSNVHAECIRLPGIVAIACSLAVASPQTDSTLEELSLALDARDAAFDSYQWSFVMSDFDPTGVGADSTRREMTFARDRDRIRVEESRPATGFTRLTTWDGALLKRLDGFGGVPQSALIRASDDGRSLSSGSDYVRAFGLTVVGRRLGPMIRGQHDLVVEEGDGAEIMGRHCRELLFARALPNVDTRIEFRVFIDDGDSLVALQTELLEPATPSTLLPDERFTYSRDGRDYNVMMQWNVESLTRVAGTTLPLSGWSVIPRRLASDSAYARYILDPDSVHLGILGSWGTPEFFNQEFPSGVQVHDERPPEARRWAPSTATIVVVLTVCLALLACLLFSRRRRGPGGNSGAATQR